MNTNLKINLAWDSYQKSICNGLGLLQQRGEFVDMTLAADGHQVKVHQMVLSLVSPYIKELITSAQCQHPIIFLNQVSYQTLQLILEYAYTGEVLVARDKLSDFLEAGMALHIKGLECENIKSIESLRLFKEKDKQEPQLENQNQTIQTEKKRNITDLSEKDNVTIDDGHSYEECESLQMDEDHLDDNDYDDVTIEPEQQSLLTERKEIPHPALSPCPIMQYTLSCQGSIQLVLNRYIYRMRHIRRNNQRVWRCINYDNIDRTLRETIPCRAMVVTKDRAVIERGVTHNHPFHDKQILKKVKEGNMFTTYNMAESNSTVDAMKKKSNEKSRTIKNSNG